MSEDVEHADWSATTFDGSRRDQLRRALALTVRQRLEAMEELNQLSERMKSMPKRYVSVAREQSTFDADKSRDEAAAQTNARLAGEWLRRALALPEGATPFPWQLELLDRFCRGDRVGTLDIPTGLGKTAVMAIWLVARARGANLPRRLVYVVDRRAVVDQATDVAEALRHWVESEPDVATALQLGDRPLPISTLRGQHVDNREWLADPAVPAIVVGTIDMVGSRLLFSGYGVSSKMRPYHAGLLGTDTLVVFDEAHLVPAFEDLLRQIERGAESFGPKDRSLSVLLPSFKLLSLSATGRQTDSTSLRLTDADWRHLIASKRLTAKKTLSLVESASVAETENVNQENQSVNGEAEIGANKKNKPPTLAGVLARQAWELTQQGADRVRCLVFCNARKDAISVAKELRDIAKSTSAPEPTIELFVGGRRVLERTMVATWLVEHGFVEREDGTRAEPQEATFLVATSAGEVGVDMDADHMVCDLVAWERMVQRFGRVNRRGDGDAKVIVVVESEPSPPTAKAKEALAEKMMKRDVANRAFKERSVLQAGIKRLEDERERRVRALTEQPEDETTSSLRYRVQELNSKITAVEAERKVIPTGKKSTPQDQAQRETLQRAERSLGEEEKATSESLKKAEKDAKERLKQAKRNLEDEANKTLAPLMSALKKSNEQIKAFKDGDAKVVARHEAEVAQHRALRKLLKAVEDDGGSLSAGALLHLRKRQDLADVLRDATTIEPLRPELTRAVVDGWSMTSLEEHPGRPEVDPWLRGFRPNDPPQTTVVWRRHLPVRTDGSFDAKAAKRFFDAAPPHTSEQLETETHLVLDWLIGRAAAVSEAKGEEALLAAKQVVAIAIGTRGELRGRRALEQLVAGKSKDKNESKEAKKAREQILKQLEDLLAGATLVVDARLGGLVNGLLNDKVNTVAEAADDNSTAWLVCGDTADVPVTGFRVRQLRTGEQDEVDGGWHTTSGSGWVRRYLFVTSVAGGEPSGALVIDGWVDDAANEDERGEANRFQKLDDHQSWAEECARGIAMRLELDKKYGDLLALAARLHDEGKRAKRWQRAFKAPLDGHPYAKTKGPIDFDILDGYRHELSSLPRVEAHAEFNKLSADDRELVLHLIATHHGFARPVIGTSGCDDAPPSIVDERARAVALRFARLSSRWGPWGLAWWEALLRAADQTASRRNQQEGASAVQTGQR